MGCPRLHTARQLSPAEDVREQSVVAGVTFVYGTRAGVRDVEAVRFDAEKFTPDQARDWLRRNNLSADHFQAAMADVAECPNGDDCPMRQVAKVEEAASAKADVAPVEIRASATGTCEIEAQAAGDTALPRVSMLAYTGVPMKLEGFQLPVVVDLETLKVPRQKIPILRGHDADRIAGHSDVIEVSAQRLKASGVLSGTPKHTVDIIHTAKNGFPWQVSIGAAAPKRMEHVPAGESVKVNGRKWDGPLLVARHAVLRELSILPMGADGNTDAGFSSGGAVDLMAQAVADLVAYDADDATEVKSLTDLLAYDPDQPRDDHGRFGEGGGGGGDDKGGGKDGSSDSKPPKLNKKDLSKAATEQLRQAADAEKRGDKLAAKNHRAAAYGFNRAAKHLDDGDKAKADAVRKAAHEFATGKRSLKAGAVGGD